MRRYLAWLQALPGRLVLVAYPAAFDFPFVYWYLTQYAGANGGFKSEVQHWIAST